MDITTNCTDIGENQRCAVLTLFCGDLTMHSHKGNTASIASIEYSFRVFVALGLYFLFTDRSFLNSFEPKFGYDKKYNTENIPIFAKNDKLGGNYVYDC